MFYTTANSVDDLMRSVFKRLLSGNRENNRVFSKKGSSTEVFGALLQLNNPRVRLGRSLIRSKVFSALGELFWYLSASNKLEHIQHYIPAYKASSDDGETLSGAYGPRIFSLERLNAGASPVDEWQRVIDLLRLRPGTRNAVIQIYSNDDPRRSSNDIPCTCTLHFAIRRKRLEMHTHMRSNDAFLGLPHDIFTFTMMQEIAARELNVELGRYQHSVASLHLYDDDKDKEKLQSRTLAQKYIDEGLHEAVPMPPMPKGDPWPAIREILAAEARFREGSIPHSPKLSLEPYWADILTLLRVHAEGSTTKGSVDLENALKELHFTGFRLYILDRIAKRHSATEVKDFFGGHDNDATGDT